MKAVHSSKSPAGRRFLWIVPAVVAAATFANVVFYFVLTQWLEEPLLMPNQFPPPLLVPMPVGEVILFSIIFALGASLVYVFLRAVSRRPEQKFIIISAVVLAASCVLPLMAPTPPIAMSAKFSLVAMHVIGAVVVVGLLVGLGRKRA